MSAQELLAEIQKLPPEEQRRLLDALDRRWESSQLDSDREGAYAPPRSVAGHLHPEVLKSMVAEGLISRIPVGISDEEDDFDPIEVPGKPLSVTIIEDRR